jgi:hypothetical protein
MLARLHKHDLFLKAEKCKFNMKEVERVDYQRKQNHYGSDETSWDT